MSASDSATYLLLARSLLSTAPAAVPDLLAIFKPRAASVRTIVAPENPAGLVRLPGESRDASHKSPSDFQYGWKEVVGNNGSGPSANGCLCE